MKKIYILMASSALMFAASCNTLDEVNTDTTVETELITVELNPATKTALGENGATTWSEGDAVSVTVKGENIGSLTLVEGTTSTFSGELKAGRMGEATLNYPAGVTTVPTTQTATTGTFADEAALLEGVTTMESLRASQGTEMKNKTALLEFSVEADGAVAFTLGDKTYTITGCVAGNTYYACVAPVENVDLSFTLAGTDGAKSKSGVTFVANKVYALGTLAVKSTTIYLKPGIWASDAAWFAVHAFNSNDAFVDIKMVDSDNDGIYEANIPVSMESVIFCRMNPAFTEFGWDVTEGDNVVEDHVWNQTDNLTIPAAEAAERYYVVEGWDTAAWKTFEEATKVLNWGIVGSMTGWTDNTDIPLVLEGEWLVAKNVTITTEDEFKFRTDGVWGTERTCTGPVAADTEVSVAAGSGNITVAVSAIYDIYLSKNADKMKLVKVGDIQGQEPSDEPVASEWGIVGDLTNWVEKADVTMYSFKGMYVAYDVEFAADGSFKIRKGGVWNDAANYGLETSGDVEPGYYYKVITSGGSGDIKVKAGTYDIWFDLTNKRVYVLNPGTDPATVSEGSPSAPSNWNLVGSFNGWNPGDKTYAMTAQGDYYVYKGFTCTSSVEMKFAPGSWGGDKGANSSSNVVKDKKNSTGSSNIKVPAGTYDIYLKKDLKYYWFMTPGSVPAN